MDEPTSRLKDDDDFVERNEQEGPALTNAIDALADIDIQWYGRLNPRYMDLVGDYAGMEPFVIDGDSLCELVLNDPLLAIGRKDDSSFQIIHAIWGIEKILHDFVRCRCVFDVIFFENNRRVSVWDESTGSHDPHRVQSRNLARSMLRRHVATIPDLQVLTFPDDKGTDWKDYVRTRKPMFVMCNSGGHPDNEGENAENSARRALHMRCFIFRLLASGVAVASLESLEVIDSKIMTFIYEHRRGRDDRSRALESDLTGSEDEEDSSSDDDDETSLERPTAQSHTTKTWLVEAVHQFLTDEDDPSNDVITNTVVYLYIAHALLLTRISIGDRAQTLPSLNSKFQRGLYKMILPRLYERLAKGLPFLGPDEKERVRLDLDGRVFLHLLHFIISSSLSTATQLEEVLGAEAARDVSEVWAMVVERGEPRQIDFSTLRTKFPNPNATSPKKKAKVEDEASFSKVLPFHNEVFEKHLSSINVEVQDDSDSDNASPTNRQYFASASSSVHVDDQHWHNRKKIVPQPGSQVVKQKGWGAAAVAGARNSQKRETDEDWARMKRERARQRQMAYLMEHAQSLTGVKGAPLEPIVIAPTGVMVASLDEPVSPTRGARPTKQAPRAANESKKSNKKEPVVTKKQKLLQQIQSDKASGGLVDAQKWWKTLLVELAKKSVKDQRNDLDAVNRKRSEDPWINVEMVLYLLHLEVLEWNQSGSREVKEVKNRHAIQILVLVQRLAGASALYPAAVNFATAILRLLGFEDLHPLGDVQEKDAKAPQTISFSPIVSPSTKTAKYPFMQMGQHHIDFQLRHFGLHMDRSMDSSSDSRVSFEPDAWQKKTLDLVDARSSILVVAPTSAGKTFISFYAMERVLRESDNGIAIYVAPTKALVNQMLAETSARFSKKIENGTLWAAHTRDYRINEPQKTQILITVPEMLAIMLLSPTLAKAWVPRLRWIILDEIHSIGQQEGGAVWEQLILMAPCPIIGLSATVGNIDEFNRWLGSVQNNHGYEHTLVEYKHRYSHLRKFHYPLPLGSAPPIKPITAVSSDAPSNLRFIHPMSILDAGITTIPDDLALEPSDCATMYDAFKVAVTEDPRRKADIASLEPTTFFRARSTNFLRQKDILAYEVALKDCLKKWSAENEEESSVLRSITKSLALETSKEDFLIPSPERVYGNVVPLLTELHHQNSLPAILFNYDRSACEKMVRTILDDLTTAETDWRRRSPSWQQKLAEWRTWKAREKNREQEAERAKKSKPDDEEPQSQGPVHTWHESFDEDHPSPEFSFAGLKYGRADLDDDINRLRWPSPPAEWTIRALERGIAVHHAGMPKNYRSLVERLFRIGFIRVMIATGTLALGINAPCKTAVFFTDSPYLTALTYRQCAGRAGRRGFDLIGNVVFYGLPVDRVYRLMTSKIPPLTGNMPLTTTLSLRLCNLLHGSDNSKSAVKSIKSFLELTQLTVSSDTGRDEVLHQIRFSIDYLRRSGLLDERGRPLTLFPVVGHLYHTEPSNLALAHLLQSGVVHKICSTIDTNSQDTLRELVLLMSHLFGRRHIPRVLLEDGTLAALQVGSPSKIVLPSMPKAARKVLLQHDREILRIFRGYTQTFVVQHSERLGIDNTLPLTGIMPIADSSKSQNISSFTHHLRSSANSVLSTSAFVATSGVVDEDITSVESLIRTARAGVHVNKRVAPPIAKLTSGRFNAYIWDFYRHGQIKALHKSNMLRLGDIWFALQDFSMAMAAIQMGLENYMTAQRLDSTDSGELDEEDTPVDDLEEKEGMDVKQESLEEFWKNHENGATEAFPSRPLGTSDGDWKVYRSIVLLRKEFDDKWRATWA
ncbi:hypothetical protein FRB94_005612 [Tulasnella sp. JGI-2019a]|nr:hypothetical protein FRB94_005612 [Tulasnella sp. JGI-2019a]